LNHTKLQVGNSRWHMTWRNKDMRKFCFTTIAKYYMTEIKTWGSLLPVYYQLECLYFLSSFISCSSDLAEKLHFRHMQLELCVIGAVSLICILPVSLSFWISWSWIFIMCFHFLSSSGKVNVLFACDLLLEGTKKRTIFW
jgi:hypothetical protein